MYITAVAIIALVALQIIMVIVSLTSYKKNIKKENRYETRSRNIH